MSILHLVEVSQIINIGWIFSLSSANPSAPFRMFNRNNYHLRIKRNESKLPKMSKEYRNEFRKDTIGENVSQDSYLIQQILLILDTYFHEAFSIERNIKSIDELEQCLRIYSNEVMSTPISWMKILGMIVFSGSLALECIAQYNFNFIHSIPHIFSTICIRPHVLEWILKQGGWVSIGQSYIMVEQKDKMILSKNHPSDISKLAILKCSRTGKNITSMETELFRVFCEKSNQLIEENSNIIAILMVIFFVLSLVLL